MTTEYTVEDVGWFLYGKGLPEAARNAGPVPVYGSNGVVGRHDAALTKGPTVIIGRKGTVGAVHLSRGPCWPIDTTFYVEYEQLDEARFAYFALKHADLGGMNSDSAVPGLNRDAAHARKLRVADRRSWPAIAAVLGSLDDKIEQNRRTSEALERLARATFKAWFVDFEPVRAKADGSEAFPGMPPEAFAALPTTFEDSPFGPIPEGWEVASLPSLMTFLNGLALQKFPPKGTADDLPVIKIAELRKGSTIGADMANREVPEPYVVRDGDLLFSWSGTLECEFWFGGTGALNQHLFKVTSDRFPLWLCHRWIHYHLPDFRIIASSKATTMGHIKREHLTAAHAVVPPENLLNAASQAISPCQELMSALAIENRKLAGLRDYLLPRLLSGEVRVALNGGADEDIGS